MNTRTVLLWHNNGETQFTFAVNPADITVSRPNVNRTVSLAMGGQLNLWGGRGLREVRLDTFLPRESSPFFHGRSPDTILSLLKSWQDSGDPIRLIISGTDINDAFLIEDVSQSFREGDGDVWLSLGLREYKFQNVSRQQSGQAGQAGLSGQTAQREDERITPQTYTVVKGDTLWDIAARFYGSGTKWGVLAEKNGITNPRRLQIGTVLYL